MSALVSRLAALCREHPLREKVVVVPSLAIGHQIGDAIARGGTPWINLRFETIRTIADAVAGFHLADEGRTVLSRAQALALVERASLDVLGDDSYFAELKDRPGLHRAIQRSLDDLRLGGFNDVPDSAFANRRKAEDLRRILRTYLDQLRAGKFIDRAGVIARAISTLERDGDGSSPATWVLVTERELSKLEERLVVLASGGTIERIAPAGPTPPKHVVFRPAVGEENEVRAAIRDTVSTGTFDDAELIYTQGETYLPLVYELAAELAIDCTFAEGIAAPYTRPGQACLAFLQWIGEGYEAMHLQRIARSGAMKGPGRAFARALREAAIGWGRERYVPRIDAWMARRETDVAREVRAIVKRLMTITESAASLASVAAAAAELVREFAVVRSEPDAMASAAIIRTLEEFTKLPSVEIDVREAAERLSDAVARLHVAASNPRPRHLHVAPVRSGGWSGRARTFVVGLDDAKHPGSGIQDPILLDNERQKIGLPLRGDEPQRAGDDLLHLVGRVADGTVLALSWSTLDLKERRERFPSRTLLELYRIARDRPDATYDELTREPLEIAGFVDRDRPLSESEYWLSEPGARVALLDAYPWLAAGVAAIEARASEQWTAYDGVIAPIGDTLDPRRNDRVYSPSQLEELAGCPFKYFIHRVLEVRPSEDLARDPDVWLDAAEFGSLVHEVLERFMKQVCANGGRPRVDEHTPLMQRIAEESLGEWRLEVPPPNETSFVRVREELERACEVFLRADEIECRDVEPKHFELHFGDDEPLRIALPRGGEIRLRGRIDRVDFDTTAGAWNVWDYKSGSRRPYQEGGPIARGRRLQPGVYAKAVEADLGGRVGKAGYFFTTAKGEGDRLDRLPNPTQFARALEHLADVAANGFFIQVYDEKPCSWCDYNTICGDLPAMKDRLAKKEAPIDPWKDLQDVE